MVGSAKAGVTAGNVNVGQQAAPLTVTVTMSRGGVAATPAVLTQGLTGLDFGMAAGGTCAAGTTYNAGDRCTVVVTFAPKYPGLRSGAVVVKASDGTLLARQLLSGSGVGGLETLVPGQIDTVAGSGAWIYTGDGVAATAAPIFLPMGLVVDAGGNLLISDSNNARIRRVDGQTGLISTIVGTGTPGYAGDGGPAAQAQVSAPAALALDGAGDIYFVDTGNHAVRRVDAVSGLITTVAGVLGSQGYTGDGGAATAAQLSLPEGLALDAAENLYIGDTGNDALRVVSLATGVIQTMAGTGAAGFNGDNRPAAGAQLDGPWGIAIGADGAVYVADSGDHRVRKISVGRTITTVAGTGLKGFGGDGAAAAAAMLDTPVALAFDPAGDLYIADSGNNRVRKVSGLTGKIATVTGTDSEQFAGDGGPADQASLYGPYALHLDQGGNLLISDMFHNRVRRISSNQVRLIYPTMRVGKISAPKLVTVENDGNAALTSTVPVLNSAALDVATTTCSAGTAVALGANCALGIEFTPTVVGPAVTGSVTAGSDAGNSPVIANLVGEVLSVDPTALSLVTSANPSLLGATVKFTATVTGSGSGWTGAVTFTDGQARLCVANLVPGGTATCSVSTLTLGTHTVGASYAGDTFDAGSTASPLTQVVKQAATLALTVAPNPVIVTNNVTLTLAASGPGLTPTGTVVFYDGGTALGSAVLSGSGGATYSTLQLTPGTHALSVQYAGDSATVAGVSNVVNEVVQQAPTVTALASSAATVAVGTTVTLTATVTVQGGPAPTGTVTFKSGTTTLVTAALGSNGVATLTLSSLAPGVQNLVATYNGDTDDSGSASAPLVETVQQIGTTTVLATDANPAHALASLHLTATVTMAAGSVADGAITGLVTFSEGSVVLGTAAVDANGNALLELSTLAVGQHTITAVYGGSTNYSGSGSASLIETVAQARTTTTLAGNASVLAGTAYTLTATTTFPAAVGSGTVTFLDAGTRIGVGTVNSQGVATLTITTLAVGGHVILAQYGGDSNYAGSRSVPLAMTVEQDPTTTAVTAGPSPAAESQSVTLTATVSAVSQNFTASVNFLDGGATIGTAMVSPGGVATLTTTSLSLGTHAITAVYGGDTNHEASISGPASELIVQSVAMLVAASANPSTSGTSLTFSSKVAGSPGSPIPTGTVTFLDGSSVLGTGTLDATGVATFTTSTMAVGTHAITATYAGDPHYGAGSAAMTETVQSAGTQIALTASASPAVYGAPVSLLATITSTGAAATGTITFTEGGGAIGNAGIDGSGNAKLTLSTLAPGLHLIIANYAGDGRASASVSTPLTISVEETTKVTLAADANPAQTLTPVVLTATVTNNGVGQPTGLVMFREGALLLGTEPVDPSGHATLTLPQFSAGSHAIVASYAGDGSNFPGTSAGYNEAIDLRPTTTAVSGMPTNPNNPQQVTLIAVVRSSGTVPPGGIVTFSTNGKALGTDTLNATGVASLTITLAGTTQIVVATYGGDSAYASSASPATTVTSGEPSQFTLAVTPATMSVASKQHGVVQVTATSIKGFTDSLQMGCLGLPYAATCTFSTTASSLAANGTMVTTLTVDTGDPLGAGAQAASKPGTALMMSFVPGGLLAGLALFRLRRRTGWKAGWGLLLAICAVAATLGVSGCASGLQVNGTPPGTYSFKVTASGTGTGATEFQVITLTVTQ